MKLNRQELNDIWSALTFWKRALENIELEALKAPMTVEAVDKLIKKIRAELTKPKLK